MIRSLPTLFSPLFPPVISKQSRKRSFNEEGKDYNNYKDNSLIIDISHTTSYKKMKLCHVGQVETKKEEEGISSQVFEHSQRHLLSSSTFREHAQRHLLSSLFRMDQCLDWFDSYSLELSSKIQFSQYNPLQLDILLTNCSWMKGLEKFLMDCGFQCIFDVKYFLLMYKMNCSSIFEITRDEWAFGMSEMQVDSITKLRQYLILLESEFTSWDLGKMCHFMSYVFNLLKENPRSRSIGSKIAARAIYCIMLNRSVFTRTFCEYLFSQVQYRVLTLDQFKMFITFSAVILPDFSNFAPEDAWPLIYDEYVLLMKRTKSHL